MRRSKKRNTDDVKRKIKKKKRRGRGNMRLDYEKCKYIRLRMRKIYERQKYCGVQE